jgi:hypothetical protein
MTMQLNVLGGCTDCPHQSFCPTLPRFADIKVTPVARKRMLPALLGARMLVIPRAAGTSLGGSLHELDLALGGEITRKIEDHKFAARLGEHLLIQVWKEGINLKYILLLGVGDSAHVSRETMCGYFGTAMDLPITEDVKCLTLPMFPDSQARGTISVLGMMSILGCRMQHAPSSDFFSALNKKIEILCSPQAKKSVESGITHLSQLCKHCTDPHL